MAHRIDCSITENYLREKARALQPSGEQYCTIRCKDCPFKKHTPKNAKYPHIICTAYEMLYPTDAISRIQDWSDSHLRKTYKDDFCEKFPNAMLDSNGYPDITPCKLYDDDAFVDLCRQGTDTDICRQCWDLPMK